VVLKYIILNPNLKFGPILNFLIYFLSLILFFFFAGYFKFELQMHEIKQCSVLKNVIHDIWCILSLYLGTLIKFRTSSLRNMTSDLWNKCFKII
jgi:hypothetical protein